MPVCLPSGVFLKASRPQKLLIWRNVLIAFGSGLLMFLAAPPARLWPLGWIALAPLYCLCLGTPRSGSALVYGLAWGIGFYGATLAWITHLHPLTWMGVPWLGSVAIATFAWVTVTAWGTACVIVWCGIVNWLRRYPWQLRIVLAITLWAALETLRSISPLDWASLALTQSPDNLLGLHLTRLSGPTTLVALMVAVNCLLGESWRRRQLNLVGWSPLLIALLLLAGGHLIGASSYWTTDIQGFQSHRLGLIQGNISTRKKLTPAGVRAALENYGQGYMQLVQQGAAAVLTPEGAIPTVWRENGNGVNPLAATVQAAKVPLWLGTFVPVSAQATELTQSLIEVGPQGNMLGRYNKIRLVPLGEYLPLENMLGNIIGRLSPLDSYLVAGDRQQIFKTSLGPAIVSICYESAYSSLLRQQAALGGQFMLTASNNDPYPPWMMIQHHALDVIRAVEVDRWALRATNTGLSGIVDNRGGSRWLSIPDTYTLHLGTIYLRTTQTPYVRWGNWLLPLLGAVSLFSLGWQQQKSKSQNSLY